MPRGVSCSSSSSGTGARGRQRGSPCASRAPPHGLQPQGDATGPGVGRQPCQPAKPRLQRSSVPAAPMLTVMLAVMGVMLAMAPGAAGDSRRDGETLPAQPALQQEMRGAEQGRWEPGTPRGSGTELWLPAPSWQWALQGCSSAHPARESHLCEPSV